MQWGRSPLRTMQPGSRRKPFPSEYSAGPSPCRRHASHARARRCLVCAGRALAPACVAVLPSTLCLPDSESTRMCACTHLHARNSSGAPCGPALRRPCAADDQPESAPGLLPPAHATEPNRSPPPIYVNNLRACSTRSAACCVHSLDDNVDRELLFCRLERQLGVVIHTLAVLRSLYQAAAVMVKCGSGSSLPFSVRCGPWQVPLEHNYV